MAGDQEDENADKAALVDAPSSQLTESATNSLVLQRTTENQTIKSHFPTLKHRSYQKLITVSSLWTPGWTFHSGLQCLKLSWNSLDKTLYDIVTIWAGRAPTAVLGQWFQEQQDFQKLPSTRHIVREWMELNGIKIMWVTLIVATLTAVFCGPTLAAMGSCQTRREGFAAHRVAVRNSF